jgi:tetratricopeptide (TPR) repeat protein
MQMGNLNDAAVPLAEGLVLLRHLRQHRAESQATHHMAHLARARGEMAEAIEFLERALRIDRKIRASRPRGLKLATMAAIRVDVGDFEGARKNLADAERICKENQERVGQAEVDLTKARLSILEGEHTAALDILESLSRRQVVSQSRILLVWHRQLTVKALLGEGRAAAAQKLADEAARIALEAGMNGEAVHGSALQGLVLAEAGLDREAASAATRATNMLAMLKKVRTPEEMWWHLALTHHIIGDTFSAKRALVEAQKQVTRIRSKIKDPRLQELYNQHPMVRGIERGF